VIDSGPASHALEMPWASPQVQRRLRDIQSETTPGSDADLEKARLAAEAVRRDIDETGIVLYAGTNIVSPEVAGAHDPWLGARAICGLPGEDREAGLPATAELEVLEVLAARAVGATMHAPYADVRPHSATLANLAAYTALVPAGATIAALPANAGGHFSHHAHGAAGIRDHRIVELPFDPERQDLDFARLGDVLAAQRPGLLILGGSVQLFPYDVARVVEFAREIGARVLCDVSHPAGLIPGGAFPNPLEQGADAITFSTYKSYAGPPGGVIATRDHDIAQRANSSVFPGLTANYDVSRLRPLHIAASELLRDGHEYGNACVSCARSLAEALLADGVSLMAATRGNTATNQLLIRMPDRTTANAIVTRAAASGVYFSATTYCDELGVSTALRIGTQELVRRGLGPGAMAELGALLVQVLRDDGSTAGLRRAVTQLRGLMTANRVGQSAGTAPDA
jgi:glycine hydroxymethyltransferase